MINFAHKRVAEKEAVERQNQDTPGAVIRAQVMDWGVTVDAYLYDAARVGQRYAAIVYGDKSGASLDGMTVATPPLELVKTQSGFKLMRTPSGDHHFLIVSELGAGGHADDIQH
ncbi:MAG: hypothetical protein A2W79_08550 [Pseudomonadales bacterium RIFCSPLOWO2_12_60_38]|jgi:hypothetical protein|uniref:hypothetical protein n=1 Tax=Pseudomonas TaxID=286 RepID=UPI0003DCB8B2|nr:MULTISPECIES: hypothetical protein [unclassified Pseudomonas]ETK41868.1 hypothetical protein H098_09780 [Pseudomonas fluorescens FH5]OHC33550.1 MAG: hypothetical protein A2W79_08550 [Pseudomonadales bacterium RIFCSPLOWO2_12_60_38]OHC40545.1 MAG: hypothetical protein A3G72_15470 [Pseudomonadales bacterium RIFCSPLOWO2_12_FULL_59_450]PTT11535.1 hypothetical protein DBR14_12995 [Pseudomonas sp. HMWF034]PVV70678.1 hypothetical protein DD985_15145 [Pseudomonas sp. HMWF011]